MNDVFDILKKHSGKRFIYGTGDGADKLLDYLNKIGISTHGICVSDDFYKERIFRGYTVSPISKTAEENENSIFMMAFGVKNADEIFKLSEKINLIYPEMPVCDESPFTKETVMENKDKIKSVYSLLADDQSKKVFESIINFRLSGQISHLKACESSTKEGYKLILGRNEKETIFDCGAYKGDTADDFFRYSKDIEEFYAAEPCPKSFEKLKEKYGEYNLYNCAIGSENCEKTFIFSRGRGSALSENQTLTAGKAKAVPVCTVDSILNGKPCTVIKYDVEGCESNALIGSENTIKKYRPSLLVAAYHRACDIFTLPLLIKSICSDYKIFMRHHPCLPSWETNIYAYFEK